MSGSQATTSLSLLVNWANDHDNWARALASEVIQSRKGISDEQAKEFYDLLLREKELIDGDKPVVPLLHDKDDAHDKEDALTLIRLAGVKRVNALATGQQLQFNSRMTVLFGENAAGKSGYVRILKSIASVRTAEAILPNVLKPRTTEKPNASLTYRLGKKELSVEWNGENGVAPFTRIDVFDTHGLLLHVDQELTYVYTPAELSLFHLVHEGIEKVKNLLEKDRYEASPKGNPFLNKFKREDPVYAKIESLGSSTNLADLEKVATVTAKEESGMKSLRERVDALRSNVTDARLQVATAERDLFSSVFDTVKTIQAFDRGAYSEAVLKLAKSEEKHSRATKEAFAGLPIPGVLGDAWRTFVESGEAYLQNIEVEEYPKENEPCIYCRQPLGNAAVELITKYRDFCNSEFKQAVDDDRKSRDTLTARVRSLDLKRTKADLDRKAAALKGGAEQPAILSKSLDFVAIAQQLRDVIEQGKAFDDEGLDSLLPELDPLLDTHIDELNRLITDLSEQAEKRKQALERESAKLRDLQARITLRELFPQIKTHVESIQWADKASTILTRLSHAVGKSLTETSKIASGELLNQNFEAAFQKECEALKVPTVRLDFPGRKGRAARRKTLVPDHRLSNILSEGEQKVLALADFIAEALLRAKASPIIFDDPVTSLDYRRLDYVVQRLFQLSSTRQVIVFTHNIWFATKILACFEKNTDDCSYYDITESQGAYGIVTRGSHPRWDSYRKTRGRINELIQNAAAASGEGQKALIERTYEYIRNVTEVIVEQELFQGVTQRFSPHVAMTKLPEIRPDKLGAAISVIYPLYEKSCRIIAAHSQPLETLGTRPTFQELKNDWAALQAARDKYMEKD